MTSHMDERQPVNLSVSVVVLAYEPGHRLGVTLAALHKSTIKPVEILVVDNSGGDHDTRKAVAQAGSVELVVAAENGGYAAGMNLGVASLRTQPHAVLFLTHECILHARSLSAMLQTLMSEPRTGAVGPLLGRLTDPSTVWSAGGSFTSVLRRPVHVGTGSGLPNVQALMRTSSVEWLDGAAILVRSDAFREIGGFGEQYFMYWEDVDLCHRLRLSGWDVRLAKDAVAWQEPGMTPPYLQARNSLIFARDTGPTIAYMRPVAAQFFMAARELIYGTEPLNKRVRLARARATGVIHGMRGHLDRTLVALR